MQLKHVHECEIKAKIAYVHKTGLTVRACGLVMNPTFPWLGASPAGLVHDPLGSVGLLEIKCPYTYHLCTVQVATANSKFFANMIDDGTVSLKLGSQYAAQLRDAAKRIMLRPVCREFRLQVYPSDAATRSQYTLPRR